MENPTVVVLTDRNDLDDQRENVRAQLRVIVKRILRKHGYPPDKQEKATQTVLEQAEVLSELWAVAQGGSRETASPKSVTSTC